MDRSRSAPIAFFSPSMRGGGAERIILNLVNGLLARGIPVDVVLAEAVGPLVGEIPSGARVIVLGRKRVLTAVGPLARYLRKERPRVLVSLMSHANVVAVWARMFSRVSTPVIVTVHNTLSQTTRNDSSLLGRFMPFLLRTFYPRAHSIVAVSRGAANDLATTSGIPRDRIEVIYNPVITPSFTERAAQPANHPWFLSGQPPVVLGVGRLTRQKDFPTLIRAFAEVRRRGAARLMILGEGPERASLTALVAELGLEADVALLGFQENALAFMAHAAVFVLSSAWEGLPTVLIEALAAGTPVIATDCESGPREILQDGRLGELVPVGDSAALARAISNVLSHPSQPPPAEALSPYTRETAVDHYLRVIESV